MIFLISHTQYYTHLSHTEKFISTHPLSPRWWINQLEFQNRNEGAGNVTDFFATSYWTARLFQLWCLVFLLFLVFLIYRFIITLFMHTTFMRPLFSRAASLCFITITCHSENIYSFCLWIKLSLKKWRNRSCTAAQISLEDVLQQIACKNICHVFKMCRRN